MIEPVPFCDLKRANRAVAADIDRALAGVVASGWFLRGPQVRAFEQEWAALCGQDHCVACNSGTDALTLAALATGMTRARIPATTLPLTAIGLARAGVAVEPEDVAADGRLAIGGADVVPVLLYGRMPNAAEAESVMFDAAHAHGWRPPAQAIACWSFYPTKSLGAFGDAGAVTTDDPQVADSMRALAGADDRLRDGRQITSRMDEMQAAVLRIKLRRLPEWLDERRAIAGLYRRLLPAAVETVATADADLNHLHVVRTPYRDSLHRWLAARGIETKVHFPEPLHRQAAAWGRPGRSLPGAEHWCATVLSLPCFPGLRRDEIERICDEVGAWQAAPSG